VRLFFLGSGAIAVPTVEAIHRDQDIALIGCGTQPDRPVGRQRVMTPTPIGQWCVANSIDVVKTKSVNQESFQAPLRELEADIILVFSFGQILKRELLNLPAYGCLNIHASLLPKYRGAAPVSAAILGGDRTTGITFMKMAEGLDSGPIHSQFETHLTGREYAPELEAQLGRLAAGHITRMLSRIIGGELSPVPQDHANAVHANKIGKTDGLINWADSATHIERQVRAYHPWPGARFDLEARGKERRLTITKAVVTNAAADAAPATVLSADKSDWRVQCGEGEILIQRVIPDGKREMTGVEFLRGCPLQVGKIL